MGPVNQTPAGTISFPPPLVERDSIESEKALVQRVFPSPIALKSLILIV